MSSPPSTVLQEDGPYFLKQPTYSQSIIIAPPNKEPHKDFPYLINNPPKLYLVDEFITNYVVWSALVHDQFKRDGLLCFIDGTAKVPPITVPDDEGVSMVENPEYNRWRQESDKPVKEKLLSLVDQDLVEATYHDEHKTSRHIWVELGRKFKELDAKEEEKAALKEAEAELEALILKEAEAEAARTRGNSPSLMKKMDTLILRVALGEIEQPKPKPPTTKIKHYGDETYTIVCTSTFSEYLKLRKAALLGDKKAGRHIFQNDVCVMVKNGLVAAPPSGTDSTSKSRDDDQLELGIFSEYTAPIYAQDELLDYLISIYYTREQTDYIDTARLGLLMSAIDAELLGSARQLLKRHPYLARLKLSTKSALSCLAKKKSLFAGKRHYFDDHDDDSSSDDEECDKNEGRDNRNEEHDKENENIENGERSIKEDMEQKHDHEGNEESIPVSRGNETPPDSSRMPWIKRCLKFTVGLLYIILGVILISIILAVIAIGIAFVFAAIASFAVGIIVGFAISIPMLIILILAYVTWILLILAGFTDASRELRINTSALALAKQLCKETGKLGEKAGEIYGDAALLAARLGVHVIIEEILSRSPGAALCWDPVLSRHILHLAVQSRDPVLLKVIHDKLAENKLHLSLDTSDIDGNNMLHLAGKLSPPAVLAKIRGSVLEIQHEIKWYKEIEKLMSHRSKKKLNRDGKTPMMVYIDEHKELKDKAEKWMKDTANACTIIAALIGTIMFAAAITVPGGSDQNTGFPMFTGFSIFTLFAISDGISFVTSVTALLMFMEIMMSRYEIEDFRRHLPIRLFIGLGSLLISILFMMLTFSVTIYLVFGQPHLRILISVATLTCYIVVMFAYLQGSLMLELISSTYSADFMSKSKISVLRRYYLYLLGFRMEGGKWTRPYSGLLY